MKIVNFQGSGMSGYASLVPRALMSEARTNDEFASAR